MAALGKLLGGTSSKLAPKIKNAAKLLEQDKLKDARAQFESLRAEIKPEIAEADKEAFRDLRRQIFAALLKSGEAGAAVALAEESLADDKDNAPRLAERLIEAKALDDGSLKFVEKASVLNKDAKGLLLKQAKNLLAAKGDGLSEPELEFLTTTAKNFPLWKEGTTLLSDRYLREGRKDADALAVYRNAYPNRKADRRLREVLLESLIANNEKDEFAAGVYHDAVETTDNPEALCLLAQYYIQHGDLTLSTAPYILRALERTQLPEASLKRLAELVLESKGENFDRHALLMQIYRQGYSERGLLSELSNTLAESGKFDALSIEIMTRAFEQRVVNKRAILILAEHCLANDRDDDFAIRVYETYLSTWPDRPQRRIYSLLAHQFAGLTKVDEQAQKIYQEALSDDPTDPVIVNILARAYHAADRRDPEAEQVYRQAFPIADGEVKQLLARILAEIHVAASDFSQETLLYLTTTGRPDSGPLAARYDEALTNCFLNAGRRGEQAQVAYYALFEKTEHSAEINPRLVVLLADLIKERGEAPEHGSVQMRVFRKLFELDKFTADAEVAFTLLEDCLAHKDNSLNLVHLSVISLEADQSRFLALLQKYGREDLLLATGDFHLERHSFPQAASAYQASFELHPDVQSVRYRLAKIRLLEGNAKEALDLLDGLTDPHYASIRQYWRAAALQQDQATEKAAELLKSLRGNADVPSFLLDLREAMNAELTGDLEQALAKYGELAGNPGYAQFQRWINLERGITLIKLGRYEAGIGHLEEIHRHNPAGRAEQLFYSLALFFRGHELLRRSRQEGAAATTEAVTLFTRAVEINRNHRQLRQVIVDVLSVYGEEAFFKGDLRRAAELFDVANRILPKRLETRIYLAYTYHRLKDFPRAIINYREIAWSDEDPYVQRSQAYAYMENGQPDKAWHVFLDLARRGNLTADDFSRTVLNFLADPEGRGATAWEKVNLGALAQGLPYVALLQHDGGYSRSVDELNRLLASDPNEPRYYWYLGQAFSHLGKRDLAVHNWKKLLELCKTAQVGNDLKQRQFTEIGLAFLNAGYAQEAMQTWDQLRQLDEKNPDLPLLYAATLDLNAYQVARKDQVKLARDEWKKALTFDQSNLSVLQNYAIATMHSGELDEAERLFRLLARGWHSQADKDPRKAAAVSRRVAALERAVNVFQLTRDRPEFDLTKIRAEDNIEYMTKANQFYWILALDKRATPAQIEREYFRLIKIFNPERHAEDFMLVEESYTNLFKSPERREFLDSFTYNPLDITVLRARLARVPHDGTVSFERLDLPASVPPPDFQQLKPRKESEEALAQPLNGLLALNFRIPDWKVL